MLAIARALGDDPDEGERILILDEPTASLPEREADLLAQMLKRFAAGGQTILFISHHLREILQLADNVTVLRDGRVAADVPAADLTEDELVTHICGRRIPRAAVAARKFDGREQTLAVDGLAGGRLNGVSFSADRGEIVGIAGLQGSGRSTLLRILFGHLAASQGSVRLRGETRRLAEPADAIRCGIAYLPEDRQGEAAFSGLSIRENVVVASLREFWRGLRMAHGAESRETQRQVERFGVVTSGPEQALGALSGGNQQKVVLARWLRRTPWLLLLDEPTQGVDVGARADIHAALRREAENGTTVLLVSSDFEELSLVCDRVLVLRDGVVAAEFHAPDIDPDSLVQESYLERKEEAS
jgi:ribose transport system ATP-binding protein